MCLWLDEIRLIQNFNFQSLSQASPHRMRFYETWAVFYHVMCANTCSYLPWCPQLSCLQQGSPTLLVPRLSSPLYHSTPMPWEAIWRSQYALLAATSWLQRFFDTSHRTWLTDGASRTLLSHSTLWNEWIPLLWQAPIADGHLSQGCLVWQWNFLQTFN